MRIIKGKMKGKKVDLEAADEPRQAEVVDLMERLRRSLEQRGRRGRRKTGRGSKRPATKHAPETAKIEAT